MLILGITGGVAQKGDYYQIATQTLTGAATSIEFTSIPQTYKHLQLRYIARTPSNSDNMVMQFNSDTASNYSTHYYLGDGGGPTSGWATNTPWMYLDALTASSTYYSSGVVDILDYTNSNKYKTIKSLAGIDLNGSGTAWLSSGNWRNTNAITNIKLRTSATRDISQYSSFALYGIKG